jgi:hypothetical protein
MPEWLMAGTWITVTEDQTGRLNEGTRPFANEFIPNREQMVARDQEAARPLDSEEIPTPPHGDKLR